MKTSNATQRTATPDATQATRHAAHEHADAIATDDPRVWTPARIRAVREAHGWLLREAAQQAGVSVRSWQRWEEPEGPISREPRGATVKVLEQLERSATRRGRK